MTRTAMTDQEKTALITSVKSMQKGAYRGEADLQKVVQSDESKEQQIRSLQEQNENLINLRHEDKLKLDSVKTENFTLKILLTLTVLFAAIITFA